MHLEVSPHREFIKKMWETMSDLDMANECGISRNAVNLLRRSMKLRRDKKQTYHFQKKARKELGYSVA